MKILVTLNAHNSGVFQKQLKNKKWLGSKVYGYEDFLLMGIFDKHIYIYIYIIITQLLHYFYILMFIIFAHKHPMDTCSCNHGSVFWGIFDIFDWF
jgi:hypothetical protein